MSSRGTPASRAVRMARSAEPFGRAPMPRSMVLAVRCSAADSFTVEPTCTRRNRSARFRFACSACVSSGSRRFASSRRQRFGSTRTGGMCEAWCEDGASGCVISNPISTEHSAETGAEGGRGGDSAPQANAYLVALRLRDRDARLHESEPSQDFELATSAVTWAHAPDAQSPRVGRSCSLVCRLLATSMRPMLRCSGRTLFGR
jgi:hypothetical protein